jgi:hypothetical protein
MNAGPAFAIRDGNLVTRYSVTGTDRWAAPADLGEAALWRGVRFMETASTPGSPYYLELILTADQVIVQANSKIAHGRTPYRDSPGARRRMYRSLHLHEPRTREPGPLP